MPRAERHKLPMRFVLAVVFLLFSSRPVPAEIYRWVDEQGTMHFADDLSGVPPAMRGKARVLLREAPSTIPAPPADYGPAPTGPGSAEASETGDFRDPVTLAEQLRAKIAAKEQLIESVDAKRSLATNPLRNRFVSPTDLELYRKYQAELPGDRERLKELESRIDSLNP